MERDELLRALAAGAAGATTLTALHQMLRAGTDEAPRMDLLGMQALAQVRRATGLGMWSTQKLYRTTLAGDLLSNTLYYSLVGGGTGGGTWARGAALGLAAGIGSVVLPPRMGLSSAPSRRTTTTTVLSIALYTAGGLAAAGAARLAARAALR